MKIAKGVDLHSPQIKEICFARGGNVLAFRVAPLDVTSARDLDDLFPSPSPPLGQPQRIQATGEFRRDAVTGEVVRERNFEDPAYLEAVSQRVKRVSAFYLFHGLRFDDQIVWDVDPEAFERTAKGVLPPEFYDAVVDELDLSGLLPGEVLELYSTITGLTYPDAGTRAKIEQEIAQHFLPSTMVPDQDPASSRPDTPDEPGPIPSGDSANGLA